MAARRFGALFEKWKILRGDKARNNARRAARRRARARSRALVRRVQRAARRRSRLELRACLPPQSHSLTWRSHVWRRQVIITAGKDKGQSGTVARVLRDQNRVIVEGYNLVRALGRLAAPRAVRR
jgi:hypothetical protein